MVAWRCDGGCYGRAVPHLHEAVVGGAIEGTVAITIRSVHVSVRVEQQLCYVDVAVPRGKN